MSRTPSSFRPQLEALEDRFAPGTLFGSIDPSPDLAFLAGIHASQQAATQTTSPVVDFATGSIVFGESTLTRTDHGITARLTVSGLQPGAYTFWVRVDAPGMGPISGNLGGHVVGESGILNFTAHVSVGEVLSGNPGLPSGPLQDPLHAQITLVVRSHGAVDPGRVHEQTNTFEPTEAFNFLRSVHLPPA